MKIFAVILTSSVSCSPIDVKKEVARARALVISFFTSMCSPLLKMGAGRSYSGAARFIFPTPLKATGNRFNSIVVNKCLVLAMLCSKQGNVCSERVLNLI